MIDNAQHAVPDSVSNSGTNGLILKESASFAPTAMRWLWAFMIFNIYSIFLVAAFQKNTPYLFDAKLASTRQAAGLFVSLQEWGWRDHYLWRLFTGVVVTGLVGFLSGAIAKSKGGIVAVISNVPSVLIWAVTFYLMAFGKTPIEGQRGFAVVSLIAIPLTTWIAFFFGRSGMDIQNREFSDGTVLGIRPYHWAWLVIPIYIYAIGILFVVAKFFAIEVLTWEDMSMVGGAMSLIALVPIIVWLLPLIFVHSTLAGSTLRYKSAIAKVFANTGVLIGGVAVALIVQVGCLWVLRAVMGWWYGGAL